MKTEREKIDEQDRETIKPKGAPKGNGAAQKPKIVFRHAWEVVSEMRETDWLLRNVLESSVLAVIAGARSTFKSFIALDWMMRIALDGRTVVILSGEGAGLDRRIDAWMRTHAPDADLKTLSIMVYERPLNLSMSADMEALREAMRAIGKPIAAVMVDTFSKFSAGVDENDNSKVAAYLAVLSENIRDEFKTTVVLVVHSGHGDATRPRGASALMANPDAEYIVERPGATAMTVTVSRQRFKDGAALAPLAYEASVIDLGRRDKYGDPVTSLALQSTDVPPSKAKAAGKNQEKALTALNEWARANPTADHITSIDITSVFKAQKIGAKRRKDVLDYLVRIRALTPSIGGFTVDQAML